MKSPILSIKRRYPSLFNIRIIIEYIGKILYNKIQGEKNGKRKNKKLPRKN